MKWKDIASFSKGDNDRTPRTWETHAGDIRIVVTRHRDYAPDKWILRCPPFFDCKELAATDIENAKAGALELVRGRLVAAMNALNI